MDASTKIENVILNITKIFSRLSLWNKVTAHIPYGTIICYRPKLRIEISNFNTRNQFQSVLLFKEFAAGYISKVVSLFFRI